MADATKPLEEPSKDGMERTGSLAAQSSASKWRIIGGVVRALKRFQSALNPTYHYGEHKHLEDGTTPTPALMKVGSARVYSTPVKGLSHQASGKRTVSGRTSSGRPSNPGTHYGHKGNMLFTPLPEAPTA